MNEKKKMYFSAYGIGISIYLDFVLDNDIH